MSIITISTIIYITIIINNHNKNFSQILMSAVRDPSGAIMNYVGVQAEVRKVII